ncbi:hypothetical protein [Fulvitalea axinellae]
MEYPFEYQAGLSLTILDDFDDFVSSTSEDSLGDDAMTALDMENEFILD